MYDLNTQSAVAVVEAEVPQVPAPELVVPPAETSADASTQQASNDDAVVESPADTVIEQPDLQPSTSTTQKVFVPHENLNLVVNRRNNADNTFEFYITNENSDWLEKHGVFESGSPIGVEESKKVIAFLAEETNDFLTVLDSGGDDLPDEGDQKNLVKLRDYIAQVGDTNTLLTKGIRYISFGSRLITRAQRSNSRVVSGLISIAYQIEGEKAVMKYRLVGQMNRDLVLKLSDIGEELMDADMVAAANKPKQKEKPATKTKVEKGSEKPNNANHGHTSPDPARSNTQLLDAVAAGNRTTQRQLQQLEGQGDHLEGQLDHVIQLVEALVVDNREIHKKMESSQAYNQALQRDLREARKVSAELLETNKSLTETLVLILDKLTK